MSSQVGSAAPAVARARREPLPLLGIFDQHPQRARQRLDVVRLDQHAGVGRHRVGNGAGRGADHRQAVRQRLGDRPCRSPRNATPARTDRRQHRARRCASAGSAPSTSIRSASPWLAISASSCAAAASSRVRSPAIVSRHGRSLQRRQRLDQHVKALARHHRSRPTASRTMPSLLPFAVSPRSVPGQRNGDEVGRHVVVVDQKLRGRRAGDDDAARGRKRVVLARLQGLRVGRRETGFQRQRMMHQREQRIVARAIPSRPPATRRTPGHRRRSGSPSARRQACRAPRPWFPRSGAESRRRARRHRPASRAFAIPRSCGGRRHSRRSASRDRRAPQTQRASPQRRLVGGARHVRLSDA